MNEGNEKRIEKNMNIFSRATQDFGYDTYSFNLKKVKNHPSLSESATKMVNTSQVDTQEEKTTYLLDSAYVVTVFLNRYYCDMSLHHKPNILLIILYIPG